MRRGHHTGGTAGEVVPGLVLLAPMSRWWNHQENMALDGESAGQCGTTGAAKMARDAGVDELVLVYRGPALIGTDSESKALRDTRRIFHGEVNLADELDIAYV